MSEIERNLPDLKYRGFMLQLSRQVTLEDAEELKYLLTSVIPAGKMESLDTILKLFRHLEKLDYIGPNNICGLNFLKRLFQVMEKKELCVMVSRFIANNQPNGRKNLDIRS